MSRQAYAIMVEHPAISYRCGSLALAAIARLQEQPAEDISALIEETSATNGISLQRLVDLSEAHNLGLAAVLRNDGTLVPTPAVIHWAQNHYGALLAYDAELDMYQVVDPTFGEPWWISTADLDSEASGYFLVPEGQIPAGWVTPSTEECEQVFGRGYPYNMSDPRDKGCKKDPTNPKKKCPPCPQGMPIWWASEPYINLWIADEPWAYTTSRGEQMALRVSIKQRDSINAPFGYPRPGLLHNWYSRIYIRGMLSTTVAPTNAFGDWTATLYMGGGGERTYSKTSLYDEESKTQLQPSYGTLTDGTAYVVPGFPLGTSSNMPPSASWYDEVSGFRVFYPDGSVDRYGLVYWRTNAATGFYESEALLTDRADPLGNNTRLVYECYNNCSSNPQTRQYRLKQVIDYDGKTNTFAYFINSPGLLQTVTSPYSQVATFAYDSQANLTNITDAVSLSSGLVWDSQGRVQQLNTPYGATSFNFYEIPVTNSFPTGGHNRINRALTVVDPNGGTNLYAYRFDCSDFMSPQFSANDVPQSTPLGTLDSGAATAGTNFAAASFRNSFHWNPRQCATLSTIAVTNLTATDYLKARMQHWLGDSNNVTVLELLSVEQEPSPDGATSGQTTFYDYAGKTSSYLEGTSSQIGVVARRPTSGTTDYTWSQFNPAGYITREVSTYMLADGIARTRTNVYVYATNTISYATFTFCGFCSGQTQLAGCSQSPSDTSVNIYTRGAYKVSIVNTSKVSFANLLLAVTNADLSTTLYGSYPQRSVTPITTCGGWQHEVTKTYTAPVSTKITNELGYVTTLTYNSENQLTSTRTASGLTISNRYDAIGFLTNRAELEIGRNNSYSYTNGLVYVHQSERGLRTTNLWDKLQRLLASSDAEGYISNRYDKLDLSASRDKLGNWTYFGYNPVRQLTAFTNASQEVSLASYCQCGTLEWTRDPLAHFTFYNSDLAGRLTNVVYPDGYSITNVFNSLDQLVQASDGLERVTNQYNLQGLLVSSVNAAGLLRSNSFDILGRPIAVTDANGVAARAAYDALGRLLTNIVAGTITNTFGYSTNGLVRATDGLGKSAVYVNNPAGWLLLSTNANQEGVNYQRDPSGNTTNLLDGKGQKTTFQFDAFNRVTNKLDDTSASVLQVSYDANGRPRTRWTPAKGTNVMTYDPVGRLRTNHLASGADEIFTYNPAGWLTNMADAVGTTAFIYSDAGQMTAENGPWDSDTVSNTYISRLRRSLSLLQSGTSPWTNGYAYDSAKRLTNITSQAGGFSYAYDSMRTTLPLKLSLPNGSYITNSYDNLARLLSTTLKNSQNSTLNSHQYSYNAASQRTQQVFTAGNYVNYTCDNIGQLIAAVGKEPGGVTNRLNEQFGYDYDAAGNLQYRTNNTLTLAFATDSRNHLTNVTRAGTLTAAGATAQAASSVTVNTQAAALYADLTFATTAGLTLTNGTNTFTTVVQYPTNHTFTNTAVSYLPTPVSFVYDLNGNLISDGNRTFDYDAQNRLTSVTVSNSWRSEFVYDGLSRRRVRREYTWLSAIGNWLLTNEVHYVCDGSLVVQERWFDPQISTNTPHQIITYTRGPDLSGGLQGAGGIGGLLAMSQLLSGPQLAAPANNVQHFYYHADGAGNITALVDRYQNIAARYLHDPFGNLLGKWGPVANLNRYRFSSKENDLASGLYFFGFRFYDPNLQRWLTPDPMGERAGLNLFGFVVNNPLVHVDPYGDALRLAGASGPLEVPGPLGYARGDTTLENLAAGTYNALPEIGNLALNTANGLANLLSGINEATVDLLTQLTGDPQLAQALNNTLAVTPAGWPGRLAKAGKLEKIVECIKVRPRPTPPYWAKPRQYYVSDGVRRSVAARESGVAEVRARLVQPGQPDQYINVHLDQLNSPKPSLNIGDSRFNPTLGPNYPPIEIQPIGLPGQSPTVPLLNVEVH